MHIEAAIPGGNIVVDGVEMTADAARAFGADLSRGVRRHLERAGGLA